jgi:hypothetical protein
VYEGLDSLNASVGNINASSAKDISMMSPFNLIIKSD